MEKSFAAASISEDATRGRGQDFFVGKSLGGGGGGGGGPFAKRGESRAEEEGIE